MMNNLAHQIDAEYRIYVACLAAYNNGHLHGTWIDCDGKNTDELQDEVNAMLAKSPCPNVMVKCPDCMGTGESFPGVGCKRCKKTGSISSAEEYAIHDHEGFGDLVGEYTSLDEVARIVETLETVDEPDAYKAYAEHVGESLPDIDNFRDAYRGEWRNEVEYAEQLFDEIYLHNVPEHVQSYIDYEKFARDLFIDDCFSVDAPGGNVFVFDHV